MKEIFGKIADRVSGSRRTVAAAVGTAGALVGAVTSTFAVGGDYDYSSLITPGSLLTDLALMVTAALGIVIGAKFAFIGASWFLKAVGLVKRA